MPVLTLMFAGGAAAGSTVLSAARPYLLAASMLFIAYGFYQTWRAKQCERRPGIAASVLLWLSALFVLVSLFFPQVVANAAANWLAR